MQPLFDIDIHQIPAIGSEPTHLHFDLRVLFLAKSWEVRAGDGVKDSRFFSLDLLCQNPPEIAHGLGTDQSVCQLARRLFKPSS